MLGEGEKTIGARWLNEIKLFNSKFLRKYFYKIDGTTEKLAYLTRINLNQKVFIRLNTILDHLIHGSGVIVDLFVANTRGDIIPLDQIKSQYFIQNLKMKEKYPNLN